jgi:hypothetical protein
MTMVADRHMSPELAETFEREAIVPYCCGAPSG